MNKLLAAFLGVSLLVNGLALAQLARGRTTPDPKARPAGGSSSTNGRKSRRSSERRMVSLRRPANSASSVSSTTRLAPMESIA